MLHAMRTVFLGQAWALAQGCNSQYRSEFPQESVCVASPIKPFASKQRSVNWACCEPMRITLDALVP